MALPLLRALASPALAPPARIQARAAACATRTTGRRLLHWRRAQVTSASCYDRAVEPRRNKLAVSALALSSHFAQTAAVAERRPGQRSLSTAAGHNGDGVRLGRPRRYVASLELDRPKSKNALDLETADALVRLFARLDADPSVRCVLLSGAGADFTSGVDLNSFMTVYARLQQTDDVAHRAKLLRATIERFQAPFKAMHAFGKPIICVQHGLCLGLGMELAACSDVRYCSRDTRMAIREVLIGIAADVGSLQLMPRLAANQSLLSELIYSGRDITVDEARHELQFVSRVCDSKQLAMEAALELAATIARRSPVAVQGSKRNLRFSREHPFEVGLDYNAVWNAAMMQGGDVVKAIGAIMARRHGDEAETDFDDL